MKKVFIFCITVLSVCLFSCSSTYQFCQLYETKPDSSSQMATPINDGYLYENEDCKVTYKLWSNGGNASFMLYNKTDDIIFINLAESFLILNDTAYDYFKDIEWSVSKSVSIGNSTTSSYSKRNSTSHKVSSSSGNKNTSGQAYVSPMGSIYAESYSYGNQNSWTNNISSSYSLSNTYSSSYFQSKGTTTTQKEKKIVAIPPHSAKIISTYSIYSHPLLFCDLKRYPEESSNKGFSIQNSPLRFINHITYTIGKDTSNKVIRNGFYVSSISNYSIPALANFVQRDEPCENVRDLNYSKPKYHLYDMVIKPSICNTNSSFYVTYDVNSNKKLYPKKESYTYSEKDDAFVKEW